MITNHPSPNPHVLAHSCVHLNKRIAAVSFNGPHDPRLAPAGDSPVCAVENPSHNWRASS